MQSAIFISVTFLCSIFFVSASLTEIKTDSNILEDAHLDTFTLIRKYGYPCEIHRVYTEDGYILEMHRIPHGVSTANVTGRSSMSAANMTGPVDGANVTGRRPVVFLQHGLLSSSAEWVLMTPGKGLAYILADAGYDVWMGNARGNTYSKHHVSMKPSYSKFWKFTWHEIGYYDIPAMIDYVLYEAGVKRVHYIGFSQGTTAFWVMTSTRPEYNDKVVAMQALAPIAFVENIRSPLIKAVAPFTNSLERVFRILGANEFLPNGRINELAGQSYCVEEAITQVLCTNLLFLLCGFNSEQLNTTMLPIVLGHTPAGSSTQQIIHFGQLYNSGQFRQFDHGWIRNKRIYGTTKPPSYDLSNIRTPVFLHYADNDWLSTPKDVDRLLYGIKSVFGKFRVPLKNFNHLDFVFAIDAKKLIYDRLLNIMAQFN